MRATLAFCILFMALSSWGQEEPGRVHLKPSPRRIDLKAEAAQQDDEFQQFSDDKFANGSLADGSGAAPGAAPQVNIGGRGPASVVTSKTASDTGITATGQAPTGVTAVSAVPVSTATSLPGQAVPMTVGSLPNGGARPGYAPMQATTAIAPPVAPITPAPAAPADNSAMMSAGASVAQALMKAMGGGGSGSGKKDADKKSENSGGGSSTSKKAADDAGSSGGKQARNQARAPLVGGKCDQSSDAWQAPSDKPMRPGKGKGFEFAGGGDVYSPIGGRMSVISRGGSCSITIQADSCPEDGDGGPSTRSKGQGARQPAQQAQASTGSKCKVTLKPKSANACTRLKNKSVKACEKLFTGEGSMELSNGTNTPSDSLMGSYLGQTGASVPGSQARTNVR